MKTTKLTSIVLVIVTFFLTGCNSISNTPLPPLSSKTNAELIQLLDTFKYDNDEVSDYDFYLIIEELEKRGASASEAAPTLARMIAFNGSTSVAASHPLVAMGSSAQSAIPFLLQNLKSEREDVRLYSIVVLGTIGESASCAVPFIAPYLSDTDPFVRSAAAGALTEITQIMLVEDDLYRLDPTAPGSVSADDDYSISKIAREWWLKTGQYQVWTEEYCELP